MVLKDSKYAKRDKHRYLKKHGLVPPKKSVDPIDKPKWSSKRKNIKSTNSIKLADSDEEWDTEDEDEFLKHFHPEIDLTELNKEQKQKIREQIVEELQNEPEETTEPETKEKDGIYLGSQKAEEGEEDVEDVEKGEHETEPEKLKLDAFIGRDLLPSRGNKRKILKNKFSDNLLEEYGLDSYSDTISKDRDYSEGFGKSNRSRNIDKIPIQDLDGFRIGDDLDATRNNAHTTRSLTEEEIREKEAMSKKLEEKKLYNRILKSFKEGKGSTKVLEINNLNSKDRDQLNALESKLAGFKDAPSTTIELDDFLEEIDGISLKDEEMPSSNAGAATDIDSFLSDLNIDTQPVRKHQVKETSPNQSHSVHKARKPTDESFLDDILG